jgi:hypothetical protein
VFRAGLDPANQISRSLGIRDSYRVLAEAAPPGAAAKTAIIVYGKRVGTTLNLNVCTDMGRRVWELLAKSSSHHHRVDFRSVFLCRRYAGIHRAIPSVAAGTWNWSSGGCLGMDFRRLR